MANEDEGTVEPKLIEHSDAAEAAVVPGELISWLEDELQPLLVVVVLVTGAVVGAVVDEPPGGCVGHNLVVRSRGLVVVEAS